MRAASGVLLLGLSLAAVAVRADAQLLRPRVEVAPYAGVLLPGDLDAQDVQDGPIVGARAGLRLPGGLGVEGQVGYAPLESQAGPDGADDVTFDLAVWLYEAGLVYALPLPGPVTPFIGVGAGRVRFDPDLASVGGEEVEDESAFVLSGGVGARLSLPGLRLRADLREHVVPDALEKTNAALGGEDGEAFNALEASVGISFLF